MDFETAVRGARSASGQSRRFRHRQSLPTYPEQQTFSAFVGMFQRLPNWEQLQLSISHPKWRRAASSLL
jgi:hypothetical protein